MAQDYLDVPGTGLSQAASRARLLGRDDALRSFFSGNAFPANPVRGQPCFRLDLNKVYVCTAVSPDTWVELAQLVALLAAANVWVGVQTFDETLFLSKSGDGAELLRFDSERPWSAFQRGAGAAADLAIENTTSKKISFSSGTPAAQNVVISPTDSDPFVSAGGARLGYLDFVTAPVTSGAANSACRGKTIYATGGVTQPNSVFAQGQAYGVYAGGAARTLTQGSGVTQRLHGSTTTGNLTLAARGFATVLWISASECVVMGDVT